MSESDAAFPGFVPPVDDYFRMPNIWIDITAEIESLAELKVVQYILRHTWGYHDYEGFRRITLDEFMFGRKRRDGTRIDKGTGLSDRGVKNGIALALKDGYIVCEIDDHDKARIKKYYRLKVFDQLGGNNIPIRDGNNLPPEQNLEGNNIPIPDGNDLPPDGKKVPARGEQNTHRSEKDTSERQNYERKRERNSQRVIPFPGTEAVLSPSLAFLPQQEESNPSPSPMFFHPEYPFLAFNDLNHPTDMIIYYVIDAEWGFIEFENKRREGIATDIIQALSERGIVVNIHHKSCRETKIVSAPPPDPKDLPIAIEATPTQPPDDMPAADNKPGDDTAARVKTIYDCFAEVLREVTGDPDDEGYEQKPEYTEAIERLLKKRPTRAKIQKVFKAKWNEQDSDKKYFWRRVMNPVVFEKHYRDWLRAIESEELIAPPRDGSAAGLGVSGRPVVRAAQPMTVIPPKRIERRKGA